MNMTKEKSINYIRTILLNYFKNKKDFFLAKPTGLANPNIPVAYNPSAGFLEIKDYVHTNENLPTKKFYVNEKCFRTVDMNLVGISNRHLSFFEMFAFFIAGNFKGINYETVEDELIRTTTEILLKVFKLNPEKIVVTLFGGGSVVNIRNIPSEENIIRLWVKYGIPDKNIILTSGLRNFVANYQWGYAGTSYEIFYQTKIGPIEIASTNKYKFKVIESIQNGKNIFSLAPSVNFAYGTGFGLERLALILNNKKDIFEIKELKEMIKRLKRYLSLGLKKIFILDYEHLKQIVDNVRAITFIMSEGVIPSSKHSREKILKNIIQNILEEINYLGLYDKSLEIIKNLISLVNKQYKKYYNLNIERTINFLESYLSTLEPKKKYSHLMQR
jgi:alanyl-tRNA synthetase